MRFDMPERRRARSLAAELIKKPALRRQLAGLLVRRPLRPEHERSAVTLACYPGLPYHRHMLWKAALFAGIRLVPYRADAADRGAIGLFWPDMAATAADRISPKPPASWWRAALNGRTGEESKRTVEQVFAAVSGYAIAIDPTVYRGLCVAKSDRNNGAHDGRMVACPIAHPEPELAYEMLVDNRADHATVMDMRVPVIGETIPAVYLKRRPLSDRFANANTNVAVAEPDAVFSREEQARLIAICRRLGLELGVELDVLRDAGDGRIYVVDANWTSWGPPAPIADAAAVWAVRRYATALVRLVRARSSGREDALSRWVESELPQ